MYGTLRVKIILKLTFINNNPTSRNVGKAIITTIWASIIPLEWKMLTLLKPVQNNFDDLELLRADLNFNNFVIPDYVKLNCVDHIHKCSCT